MTERRDKTIETVQNITGCWHIFHPDLSDVKNPANPQEKGEHTKNNIKFKFFFLLFYLLAPSVASADSPSYTYPESITQAIANASDPSDWLLPSSDVVTIPDNGGTHGLRYSGSNLIVRTATSASFFSDKYVGYPNYTIFGPPTTSATWVTTGNDFTSFYDSKGGGTTNSDLIKVVERGLGMNNGGTHNAIVEFTASPDVNTIIRPTKKPDIATYNSAQYGNDKDFLQASGMTDAVYNNFKAFYAQHVTKSYTQPYDANKSFPFTQLAYTFFWGHGSKTVLADIKGSSEFILLGGTSANIYAIYSTVSYIYTKNNGEYGNGYPNFNITGDCNTVWAGHSYQANVSRSASSPNWITIGDGATMSGGEGILVWSINYNVTNNGTITGATAIKYGIAGTSNIAILFWGDTSTLYGTPITEGINKLTNSGTISSPGTAVESYAGNTTIINNAGATISGDTCAIRLWGGTNTIINHGTISNIVDNESLVDGGEETAALRVSSGTTSIINTGTINGHVVLDADPTAALDVGANNLVLSGGGTYNQGAGATLKLTANSATNFGKVTAAGASLDPESKVAVRVGGYIPNNTAFKIVDTSGAGVENVPGTITTSSPVFSFAGSQATGDLIITATRAHPYNALAATPDARAVGAALESIGAAAAGDMATVLNTLDSLTSATQLSDSLESMHPDMSSGNMQTTQAIANQFRSSVATRLGYVRNGLAESGISTGDMIQGMGFWLQGLGSHAQQDTRKGIEGFQYNTFGTSFGADKIMGDHVRVGLAGGYGYADVNSKTIGSPRTNINGFQGTLYGSYDSISLGAAREKGKYSEQAVRTQGESFWYADAMFGFTQNNYDSSREVYLGNAVRLADATHYGQQYTSTLEAGYTMAFKRIKPLEVTPFASLEHSYLYMNSYKESGADALNLNVEREGFNALVQGLGVKLAYPLESKKFGTFVPTIRNAWQYDYIGDRYETTASFAGGGPSFNTTGAKPAQHGMIFGAALVFLNQGNMTLTANWDWELKEEFSGHTYYGTLRFDF